MPRTTAAGDITASILDATARLLARYGYSKTTIEDVAREAGIGKGSVYLHFASKEEVVLSPRAKASFPRLFHQP